MARSVRRQYLRRPALNGNPESTEFDIPPKCSLQQAALWVWEGVKPIPDNVYEAAALERDFSKFNGRELVLRLRAGLIRSWGHLYLMWRRLDDTQWEKKSLEEAPFEPLPIPDSAWTTGFVDWENATLSIPFTHASMFRQWKRFIESMPLEEYEAEFKFVSVNISTSDLVSEFPGAEPDQVFPPIRNADQEQPAPSARGRPPEYNWDVIWAEIAVRADLDGLPATQAECVELISDWYKDRFNEKPPGKSTLKSKLSRIYSDGRKARK